MQSLVKYALVTNIVLGLLFIYANYTNWEIFRGNNVAHTTIISTSWSPLIIGMVLYGVFDGRLESIQTVSTYTNTPYLLFWILMLANMYFIWKLPKNKQN